MQPRSGRVGERRTFEKIRASIRSPENSLALRYYNGGNLCLRVFAFLRPLFQARLPAGFITVFLLRRRARTDRTASRSVPRLVSGFLLVASLTARVFTYFSHHFVLALFELARFASSAHRCALIAPSNRLFSVPDLLLLCGSFACVFFEALLRVK